MKVKHACIHRGLSAASTAVKLCSPMSDDANMNHPPKCYTPTRKPISMEALDNCYALAGVTADHKSCVRCLEEHGAEHRARSQECA
jgi:hypothetical protein